MQSNCTLPGDAASIGYPRDTSGRAQDGCITGGSWVTFMQTTQGIAQVNGAALFYEVAGSGPALVLIHGNTLDTRMWDLQVECFASRFRVIRYDMRGFGRSATPAAEAYSAADDLAALLRYLEVSQAHILGLSLGGLVAIDFALDYPQMTHTLIAADAGLRDFQWQSYGEFSAAVRTTAQTAGIEAAKAQWLAGDLFSAALEHPGAAARLRQVVADYSGWHWLNRDPQHTPETSAMERLASLRCPALVIVGERDLADFRDIADLLQRRIPGASRVVLPGVGHMSNLEDAAQFNALVLDFLAAPISPAS